MDTRALRDLEASRAALSRSWYQPNPQKGGYPAPDRVTFLTGPNRDFPKRRQHELEQLTESAGAKRHIIRGPGRRCSGWDAPRGTLSLRFCPEELPPDEMSG
jgi:hypothetical protein